MLVPNNTMKNYTGQSVPTTLSVLKVGSNIEMKY